MCTISNLYVQRCQSLYFRIMPIVQLPHCDDPLWNKRRLNFNVSHSVVIQLVLTKTNLNS